MEKCNRFSPDRNILCLFDVDGTLTQPREVRVFVSRCSIPLLQPGVALSTHCVIAGFVVTGCCVQPVSSLSA